MEREVLTYYYPNMEGEVREGPFQGRGRAWVRGKYAHPDYPSPLDVRVGDAGVKVWMLTLWLRLSDNEELSGRISTWHPDEKRWNDDLRRPWRGIL